MPATCPGSGWVAVQACGCLRPPDALWGRRDRSPTRSRPYFSLSRVVGGGGFSAAAGAEAPPEGPPEADLFGTVSWLVARRPARIGCR